ncbi:MAG: radical SAM protein [Lachnospiraceae bacterium]|nr:radical SAM protein [Lachnospiraceae bacterium]
MKELLISHYVDTTKVLGPYDRSALWVHGCCFECPGCIAKEMNQNIPQTVKSNDIAEVFARIGNTEGITISGGEPFLQAEALAEMIDLIKKKRDYGVIVYTGFLYENLKKSSDESINKLLNHIDILVDGQYKEELDDGKPFRGSSNQRILELTDRYHSIIRQYYYESNKRNIEINIKEKNVYMIGVPSKYGLQTWKSFKAKAEGKNG